MDEESLSTVGIIDVLDIVKVFSGSYRVEDSIDTVRANWQIFIKQSVKDVFGPRCTVPSFSLGLT
jgi:hypothetical protein